MSILEETLTSFSHRAETAETGPRTSSREWLNYKAIEFPAAITVRALIRKEENPENWGP